MSFHTTRWRIVMKAARSQARESRPPYQRSTERFILYATPRLDPKAVKPMKTEDTRLPQLHPRRELLLASVIKT